MRGVVNVIINDGQFDGAVVSVTNVLGQTVLTQSLNAQINRIDLNDFGKGIYMVTIQRGDEHFARKVSFR